MKLHFESDLPYQRAAIDAVCNLFQGQEVCRSVFTVTAQALNDLGQQSFEGRLFTSEGGTGGGLRRHHRAPSCKTAVPLNSTLT